MSDTIKKLTLKDVEQLVRDELQRKHQEIEDKLRALNHPEVPYAIKHIMDTNGWDYEPTDDDPSPADCRSRSWDTGVE
jgi:ABC-type phosphate transport system auxiliary subunit